MNAMNKVCARCPAGAGCKLVRGTAACRNTAARFGFNPKPRQIDRIQAMGVETLARFIDRHEELQALICRHYCPRHRVDRMEECPLEFRKKHCHQATINYLVSYVGEEKDND